MPGIPDPDRIIAISPFGRPDGRIVVAAARAGATSIVDLGTDEARARVELDLIVARCGEPFGVRLGPTAPTLDLPAAVTTVVVTDVDQLGGAAFEGRRVLAEVTSLDDAARAVAAGAAGVIAKGSEAGGVIGDEPAFVLLQRLVRRSTSRSGSRAASASTPPPPPSPAAPGASCSTCSWP